MDINLIPSVLSGLQEAGLTQSEIGEAVGCSQSTISDMVTGKSGLTRPSYKIISGLEALAELHGVATESPAMPSHRPARRYTDPAKIMTAAVEQPVLRTRKPA